MKVYKNPWSGYESYFVKTGVKNNTGLDAVATGYSVSLWDGKWEVLKSEYTLQDFERFTLVAENHVDLQNCIDAAIRKAVLSAMGM